MKIGLINPNKNSKHPSVHVGLGYIAAYALEKFPELEISILDTRISSEKEIRQFCLQDFDLIGITATTQVFAEAVAIIHKIKAIFPTKPVCIGGPHVSTYKEEAMKGFPFDYGIINEGEESFCELILYLMGKMKIEEIKGLFYKDIKNEVCINQNRNYIENIDKLPFPAYHLFKMNKYPQHRLVTSRGCPFDCVFCNSSTLWSRKWRSRNPVQIIDEIQYLIQNFGRKTFIFNDDSFNINQARVIQFCDLLINQKLNIIWSVPIRIDLIKPDIALKMKQAGCFSVSIGIESANNEVLKKMNKNNTIEKIQEGISILKKVKIHITGQFMIGNPGDTLETIKESILFAKSSALDNTEFYTALPYKGSALWEFVEKQAKMLTDLPAYHFHEMEPRIVFETAEFTYEQRQQAIQLAIENGYYNALSTDRKNILLDMGKKTAQMIQKIFSGKLGNIIYLKMRTIYHKLS